MRRIYGFGTIPYFHAPAIEHLKTYLEYERVVACGCVWFAPPEVVAAQKFDLVRDAAHKAVTIAESIGSGSVSL